MKKVTAILSTILLGMVIMNLNTIFDYESNIEVQASEYVQELQEIENFEELEEQNKLNNLASIEDYVVSGNLNSMNLSFTDNTPIEQNNKDLDDKKVFFFGYPADESESQEFEEGGDWGESTVEESNENSESRASNPSSNEPIEVTFDRFLEGF